MTVAWNHELSEQLTWHWEHQLRARFAGLSDEEYFWEPVDGCWNVRRRGTSVTKMAGGAGEFVIDFEFPQPEPEPVTTIAWRLGHLIVGVFGARVASHFGGPAVDYYSHDYAGTAQRALDQLDAQYDAWIAGVRSLGEDGLARACGEAEPYPELTMAALVLHIHREVIHHGAEIALLRDLYRAR
uniref:DinB family protein n=1 Tax=Catenuloplanes japonicus TaxID=33876 RepID=UPI000525F348|nr:DinB family protein [Catenuloplanes japonicus]